MASLLLSKKLSGFIARFREATQTVAEPSEKWTEVWSHIYLE